MQTNKLRHIIQGALMAGLLVFSLASCNRDKLTSEEEEALNFLYSYMPLPDSVDYPRPYWEACVRSTFKAREEMPWGSKIPEREWKYFVLPVRVNNENLDSARIVLYEELKDRVKDKTMYGAVLEVNHWCHEHVTYQPSDSRTSSPLATMRSAIGRCGEESTFTVSALRAVGIPARQVYTPRWAHTDDNHAWVEAWVDGKWYFLGACEPEPVLNLGWFNGPASRGMLMHTKAFGNYDGKEEVMSRTACYTEINVTQNYAPTSLLSVHVVDADNIPVEGATVDYRLYNYAELYTLVSKQTDAEGRSSLTCGHGDLVVWASYKGKFGFGKATVGKDKDITVRMDKDSTYTGSMDLTLIPPTGHDNVPEVDVESYRKNRQLLEREDSIRNAYEQKAFYHAKGQKATAAEEVLEKARGNWQTIDRFQKSQDAKGKTGTVVATLCDKDLRDVSLAVLEDAARHTPFVQSRLFEKYVLAPRISNEMLTPYRALLRKVFTGKTPQAIAQWVQDSIQVDDTRNPMLLCMSPVGVYHNKVTDHHSRDIFFVAAARSAGIVARIDEVTGKVQWADSRQQWHDVTFGAAEHIAQQGTLTLTYINPGIKENPNYYSYFTLSLLSGGTPHLQEYPEAATWADDFAHGTSVDAGRYLMVSGTRLASGGVLCHLQFFGVQPGEQVTEPLVLRKSTDHLQVIGSFNCELGFTNYKGVHKSILDCVGRGYYLVALIRSNHEPSTHVLHDFEDNNIYLAQWPHAYLMLFPSESEHSRFKRKDFDDLPSNFVFGTADKETVQALQIPELVKGNKELPILMICDSFNRVVWFHQGYTIGIADQVMDVIRQLEYEEQLL